jgi:hypothetical protein
MKSWANNLLAQLPVARPVPLGRKTKPDGLTLYPIERLGNQLFSYAAVFAQAHRLSVPCYVNKAFYEFAHPKRPRRYEYELDVFDNGLISPSENAYHLPVYLEYPTNGSRVWHNSAPFFIPGRGKSTFMERSFRYDPRLREVKPGRTVLGYFQSWRYFDDCGAEIRARMSRLTKPSDWYLEMCERIKPGSGTIGLHVRRGDYLAPSHHKFYGLAERAYYERALSCLRQMGLSGPVYVSTDSKDIVSKEFAGMGAFLWIDPPPEVSPYEVVLVLSRVDGLITANSSFSWWAGYLGERPGRVVIAPRPWLTSIKADADTRDLLPPNWLTLDRGDDA